MKKVLYICIVLLILTGCGIAYKVVKDKKDKEKLSQNEQVERKGPLWLEIPLNIEHPDTSQQCITHWAEMEGKQQRNYSLSYDADSYTAYWVAYPLCSSHISTGREEFWGYDTQIPISEQTNVKSGYGGTFQTLNYAKNFYARGHQIPNADRSAVAQMQAQTYFSTNMTPQIQNGFNGGIWAELEKAVRELTPENDTLYIITGAAFYKLGHDAIPANYMIANATESAYKQTTTDKQVTANRQITTDKQVTANKQRTTNKQVTASKQIATGKQVSTSKQIAEKEHTAASKTIKYIVNKNDGKSLPVPNYYWKAVLKVKRDESGLPIEALTIAFWLPHEDLKKHDFTEFIIPVDTLEAWTGFDMFHNLAPEIQNSSESNTSWLDFQNY